MWHFLGKRDGSEGEGVSVRLDVALAMKLYHNNI